MSISFKRIGQRIREIRNRENKTQAELAELIGRSVPYISHIETGTKKVSLTTLILIANALSVTVDSFLYGNQTSDPSEYRTDIGYLMEDCSSEERRLIYEIALALKNSLRSSSRFHSTKNQEKLSKE